MGINHAEIVDGNVIREWVLFEKLQFGNKF